MLKWFLLVLCISKVSLMEVHPFTAQLQVKHSLVSRKIILKTLFTQFD